MLPSGVARVGAVTATLVRLSGRSWWQAKYVGGKVLSEWDTVPGIRTSTSRPRSENWRSTRWEEVPKQGLVALRLLCPDGRAGELQTNNPEGRFVQLKVGGFNASGSSIARYCDAHLIGVVGDDGSMQCWAWEREPHIWQPNLDGERVRCNICKLPELYCGARKGQLVAFTDTVFNMQYRLIGALSLVVQGVRL